MDSVAEGTNLYDFAQRHPDGSDHEWSRLLEGCSVRGLVVAVGMLASSGIKGEQIAARRDSAAAILHVKLTEQQIETMDRLDAAATRLSKMTLYLTGAAALVGLVSLVGLF